MRLDTGIVLRSIGGFYIVYLEANKIITCTLRGRLKQEDLQPMVGDKVEIERTGEDEGVLERILPRQTRMYRPPIANVNQVVMVFSTQKPQVNLFLLDRLLVLAESNGLDALICINKMDLIEPGQISPLIRLYQEAGYRVVQASTLLGQGEEELEEALRGRVSVIAGPSGTGKSSILNKLYPGLELKTAQVSDKLKSGRHTTRHVRLIPLDTGGFVADTPGFSQLTLKDITAEELPFFFPEMERLGGGCRFNGCLHYKEPGCAVKQGVSSGAIGTSRYDNYIRFLLEVQETERRY